MAGGHLTDPPREFTYSSVVSRDTVHLFFLLAALNNVDVLACDVQNAYVNAETKEKVWFCGGKDMDPDKGKVSRQEQGHSDCLSFVWSQVLRGKVA